MAFTSVPGFALIVVLLQFPAGIQLTDAFNSSIPFNVTQALSTTRPATLDGRSWRHNFDILLTHSGQTIRIFDEFGEQHDFAINEIESSSNFSIAGDRLDSGLIERIGDTFIWQRTSDSRVEFNGSLPVRIQSDDNQTFNLGYDNGRLTRVVSSNNDGLEFNYTNGMLVSVTNLENEFSCEQEQTGLTSNTESTNDSCDSISNPPNANFQIPSFPGALAVDLRPASCNSYFVDYFGTSRGQEIESGLDTHPRYQQYASTVRSFPIVDLITENELLVIRSRDLTSTSYDSTTFPEGLYRRLLQDAVDIQDRFVNPLQEQGFLETTELGETTRVTQEILQRPIVLEIIIRHGFATPAQIQQINRARATIAETYGIELRIVEIP